LRVKGQQTSAENIYPNRTESVWFNIPINTLQVILETNSTGKIFTKCNPRTFAF